MGLRDSYTTTVVDPWCCMSDDEGYNGSTNEGKLRRRKRGIS